MSIQAAKAWHDLASKMPAAWANLVNGLQVNQVVCSNPKCKHVYHNFEPFSMLTLDIPSSKSEDVHLSDCLRAYMLPETMSEWKCDKCHQNGSQKLVRFWCAPSILVIALKRFGGTGHKVNTPVTLPDIFELTAGSELCRNLGGPKSPPYTLKAVGCHFGSLGGGHYTALGRDSEGSWLHLDDLNITVLPDSSQVLKNNQHAYMLFYER
jgi:ubiquitin C-terminal hydrolase